MTRGQVVCHKYSLSAFSCEKRNRRSTTPGQPCPIAFEVQRLCSEYDELWIRNGRPDASISFACPLEEGGVGRRRYDLPESGV